MLFYFSPSLLSSLLASRFAKVVSERRFLRTNLVLNFKSGALRTLSIFEDGSEEAERSESATLEFQYQTGSKETAIRNNLREVRSEEAGKQGR